MSWVRRSFVNLPPVHHGGPGDGRAGVIDFSVNTNPLGPPAELVDAIRRADVSAYPDPEARISRELIAHSLKRPFDEVVLGRGTAELMYRLADATLDPFDCVVAAAPTFNEFFRAAALRGANVHRVLCYQEPTIDVGRLVEAIERLCPKLVWICHPNNPTGHAWTSAQLQQVAAACSGSRSLLCLDLAYVDMASIGATELPELSIRLRSPTKSFAIPGLRLGVATMPVDIAGAVHGLAPAWALGAPEIAALGWIFSEQGKLFLRECIAPITSLRENLRANLELSGATVFESQAPFFLVDVGNAEIWKNDAMSAGIRLRSCADFGMAHLLRLAVRGELEQVLLLNWWKEYALHTEK